MAEFHLMCVNQTGPVILHAQQNRLVNGLNDLIGFIIGKPAETRLTD